MHFTRNDGAQPCRDVGVVIEAKYGVSFRQRRRKIGAVPLRQTTNRDDGTRAVVPFEIGRRQKCVDGVLFRRLDKSACVDDDGVGIGGIRDEFPPISLQPSR